MRVRFTGASGFDQRVSQGAASLREGREYVVLEIFAQVGGANKIRVEISEEQLPPLFDSRLFELVSNRIPCVWEIHGKFDGSLVMRPGEWNSPGFWESLMDREQWAVEAYRSGRTKIFEDS